MVDFENISKRSVYDLQKLMHFLCSDEGCPWDKEQTHRSIRRNLLEEAYEAAEAIDNDDMVGLCEELGDILMQVVFHSDMAEKAGAFVLDDVADAACKKLIRRHPHLFGEGKADTAEEVLQNWENIKALEKQHKSISDDMEAVARSLPSLWRAEKVQRKAATCGFDWPEYSGALEAVDSELHELKKAISGGTNISEEIGDLLFSLVNLARHLDIDPEEALGKSCDKFINRFAKLEQHATKLGRNLSDMSLNELDDLYNQAKMLCN